MALSRTPSRTRGPGGPPAAPPRRRRAAAGLAATAVLLPMVPLATSAAAAPGDVTVTTDRPVYLAKEGTAVRIGMTATVEGDGVLGSDVVVSWTTRGGTATPDVDYAATGGSVTFPKGSASGTVRYVQVRLLRDGTAETAETVPLAVSTRSTGAKVTGTPTVVIDAHGLPYLDRRLPVQRRVADLMRRMTLEEKVGQMTQAERANVTADPDEIAEWGLGSLLSGGGSVPASNTPEGWADMVDGFQSHALQTRLQIPMIYGVDSVHGHNNVKGATVFPHNIGLGASRDPRLVERIGHVTAKETRATGIPWAFAPCVCVTRDARWGRSYESFGEDPALVVRMTTAIDGLQGRRPEQLDDADRVLASTKHFAGDGNTRYGTGSGDYPIDQGVTVTSRADFERLDLAPYVPAVRQRRTGTVMPSFSSVDWTEDGTGNPVKMHANRELLTDVLKGRLGFQGFVISDWEAIHQLPGDWPAQVRTSINAGVDMAMEPAAFREFVTTLLAEVRAGRVPQARVDDAVRRILTKKLELGLFEQPFANRANLRTVGSPAHRAVARQAVAQSQVLLKNSGGALPLDRNAKVYVAGRNADDMGNQSGGWTLTWQGFSGTADQQPGTTILEGIREVAPGADVTYSKDGSAPTAGSDVGVVVIGETPYSEGFGDVGGPRWGYDPADGGVQREPKSLDLQEQDRAVVDKVCAAIETCVVLVVSGRPQVIPDAAARRIDGLVASWLPGTEGAGVADVLFGDRPFTGRLPVSWPRTAAQEPVNVGDATYTPAYPYGWGLRTDPARARVEAVEKALGTDPAAQRARTDLRAALAVRGGWSNDGAVRDAAAVLPLLTRAATALGGTTGDQADVVLGVVRDAGQQAVVTGKAPAALIADADRQLAAGRPDLAGALLAKAAGAAAR